MRLWWCSAALAALTGCASPPAPEPPSAASLQALLPPDDASQAPVGVDDVFALGGAMPQKLAAIQSHAREHGAARALADALYPGGRVRIEYDSARTRTAAETFEAGRGNCLSLVLMTAAFAKALGVPVQYQLVQSPATWSRARDLQVASVHLNIALGQRIGERRPGQAERLLTIDFLPQEDLGDQRVRSVSEQAVLAMFFNNRAAEALAGAALPQAEAYAREAVRVAPQWLIGWNTLAVVQLRRGDASRARALLEEVLAREPENALALANLVVALERSGEPQQARAAAVRLAALEPQPPFHFFDQGMAALQRGELQAARALFERELRRDAYYHEFHFWLAIACQRLGDNAAARRHMAQAIAASTTQDDRALYAAKLDHLRAHPTP